MDECKVQRGNVVLCAKSSRPYGRPGVRLHKISRRQGLNGVERASEFMAVFTPHFPPRFNLQFSSRETARGQNFGRKLRSSH